MKVSTLLAAAASILTLSAGAALAAEGCECCKDMAADAEMSCCDKMKAEDPAPQPTPPPPSSPSPSPDGAATGEPE